MPMPSLSRHMCIVRMPTPSGEQALSVSPEYLKNAASESGAVVDFEHWQLPLGRRFRVRHDINYILNLYK